MSSSPEMPIPTAFHIMTKPIGPICNLGCKYCFYLEKEALYPDERRWKMSDKVLETYIKQYIEQQETSTIYFAWQGGEPTLLGIEYFHKVVHWQKKYANGKAIHNALQTNGTLLDDEWCAFLADHKFLIGISIDGPQPLHDFYRVDKQNKGTFDKVMHGIEFLKKYRVEFNTLTVVNRKNSMHPSEIYQFLCDIGSGFIQFIPLIERQASPQQKQRGYDLASPPDSGLSEETDALVTPWSVGSHQYGVFLCEIFDRWVRRDVGRIFVQLFDVALSNWMGMNSGLCLFDDTCGTALAMEHNGDLYSCDHYVYPQYQLGNIMNQSLGAMVQSKQQVNFGNAKRDTLPEYCKQCDVRFACHGECPKHRFTKTPDGEDGLNYLCPSYKKFFHHIDPYMVTMAELLRSNRPAADIMEILRVSENRQKTSAQKLGRNDLCSCGSGKKYKKCCEKKTN